MSLLLSTYLGGSGSDHGPFLSLDTSGNVYATGYTSSSDFPTTVGVYDASYNGGGDVFVLKLDGRLTILLSSTYMGGSNYEYGNSLALDTSGNIYVTGYTKSSDFPTTVDAYATSYNDNYDVFISKLNNGLTNLLASTYMGGSNYDYGYALALDTSGNVYVNGTTFSPDFPTTADAYATSFNGDRDIFISKLDSGLVSLLASTYLGGSGNDSSRSLFFDTNGNIYLTGFTTSSDFPTTNGAYDTSYNDGDVFVSKLDNNLSGEEANTDDGDEPEKDEYIDFSGTWKGKYSSNRVDDMKITIKLKKKSKKKFSGTWKTSGGAYGDCTIKYNKKGVPKLKIIETYPCDGSFKGKLTYYTDTYFEYELKGKDCESSVKAEGYASKKN